MLVACTIAANNYLGYVRVFARSLAERHPDAKIYVLLVDRRDPTLRYEDEPFEIVFAEDLGIDRFLHFAFRYSILELSTAVKPYFLLHLHRRYGIERVLYFDPDILVLGDLGELWAQLDTHDALLIPHVTAPIEDAGTPSEQDLLLSGIYNLGFLGMAMNPRTLPFLDWWRRRLYHLCLHEVWRGLFVDQRWMDFAPAFLERLAIVRDPGYNVAYWNLMHRPLTEGPAGWTAAGTPLRFFHFSGFDLTAPDRISKYQNRYALDDRPDLVPLFRRYGELLQSAGHDALRGLPYAFGRFDNGLAVPRVARWALRMSDADGERWPDPFATGAPDSFFDWLAGATQPKAVPALPRIAVALWDMRADLRSQFPQPHGRDGRSYLSWLRGTHGALELERAWLAEAEASLAGALQAKDAALAQELESTGQAATPRGIVLPQQALELHAQRHDLRLTFPEPLGASSLEFAVWFATYGRLEYDLQPAVVWPVLKSLPWRRRLRAQLWWTRERWRARHRRAPETTAVEALALAPITISAPALGPAGVNVIGWISASTGVGEACRGTLAALTAAEIPHADHDLARPALDSSVPAAPRRSAGLPYEVSIYHVNADMMANIYRELPLSLQDGRYRIGYWFWELAHFPLEFAEAFEFVDEVWAPSQFCAQAFRSISPREVRLVPPCVPPPTAAAADRASLGIPRDAFLFYNAFDAQSIPERKNPSGLLAAFRRVVADSPRPVHLLIKLSGAGRAEELVHRLRAECKGLPVTILDRTLRRDQVDALMATADAYVSLHRSEGLGLPLIEAMYLGKPVIATDYGGSTDFLDETTGWPVPYELVPLSRPQGPYPAGAVWAEPNRDTAADAMLDVSAQLSTGVARITAARHRIATLYSLQTATGRLLDELRRIGIRREHAGWSDILGEEVTTHT